MTGPRACRSPASRSIATSSASLRVVRTRADLRAALADAPRPVGLVPTMGWLHAGHVSLVERARAESATVVMSIFVNPRQFGEAADFEQYPRNEASDLAKAEAAGVDIVFAPTVDEVYPPGFDTSVSVGAIAGPLEGAARPGHFDGVATVVAILFALVGAERAYFGLKDYQQVRVIRRMALDLALPTTVVPCATVREPDGLAMSSRNQRLTSDERIRALALSRALNAAEAEVAAGERDAETIAARARAAMDGVQPEYLALVDPDSFQPIATVDGRVLVAVAAPVGAIRLIDNTLVQPAATRERASTT
jgi:pantoate--beta-alanine ligase